MDQNKLKSAALLIAYDPQRIMEKALENLKKTQANSFLKAYYEALYEHYEKYG